MVFAALLLLSPLPLFGDVVLPVSRPDASPVVSLETRTAAAPAAQPSTPDSAAVIVAAELSAPSMPEPKAILKESSSAELTAGQPGAFVFEPVKPATHRSFESRNQKRMWYGLAAAGHAGAAFDAWSTRRALSGNWGTEADPLMRPFAHSGTVYVATQVGPVIMDLIGKRAMNSENRWIRKFWWVPQTVGASMSFRAGINNVGVVH
jgi:hypothetical protein